MKLWFSSRWSYEKGWRWNTGEKTLKITDFMSGSPYLISLDVTKLWKIWVKVPNRTLESCGKELNNYGLNSSPLGSFSVSTSCFTRTLLVYETVFLSPPASRRETAWWPFRSQWTVPRVARLVAIWKSGGTPKASKWWTTNTNGKLGEWGTKIVTIHLNEIWRGKIAVRFPLITKIRDFFWV